MWFLLLMPLYAHVGMKKTKRLLRLAAGGRAIKLLEISFSRDTFPDPHVLSGRNEARHIFLVCNFSSNFHRTQVKNLNDITFSGKLKLKFRVERMTPIHRKSIPFKPLRKTLKKSPTERENVCDFSSD